MIRHRIAAFTVACVLIVPALGASADKTVAVPPRFAAGTKVGAVQSTAINEASGMAASRKNPGVLWVHNDSGDSARVFAMDLTGKHLGIYNLGGASAVDWEDMAVGPGPVPGQHYLYLGDIGDNNAVRSTIAVYRVSEPAVSTDQAPVNENLTGVEKLTLKYEDGPRDAETLMVDPANGDLYVVSKRESRSRVYHAPAAELMTTGTVTLRLKVLLQWGGTTAGDISPRGDEIVIRGYNRASVWCRFAQTQLWEAFSGSEYAVPIVAEPQGEAVCYDSAGTGYYTTSEGANQPIYYFARDLEGSPDETSAPANPCAGPPTPQ